jgi:hypothetical protein
MRPFRIAAVTAAAALALASTSFVAADDSPPTGKSPAAPPAQGADKGGDKGSQAGADAKKDEPAARIEKAKQLVKELEEAVARAKAAQPVDAALLQKLLTALDEARALTKPIKLADLTPEEKKALAEEFKKDAQDDAKPEPSKDPNADWAEKQLAKAFEGADLSEEEEIKAKKIIGDWFGEARGSFGDSKKTSDLKRKRDDDLEKAIGKRKAQKVINNLNSMAPGGRGK